MRYMILLIVVLLWAFYLRGAILLLNFADDRVFYGGLLFAFASLLAFPKLLIYVWRNVR